MKNIIVQNSKNTLAKINRNEAESIELYYEEKTKDSISDFINCIFKNLPFESDTATQKKLLEFQHLSSWKSFKDELPLSNVRIHIVDKIGNIKENCFLYNDKIYKEIQSYSRFLGQNKEIYFIPVKEEIKEWRYDISVISKIIFSEDPEEHNIEEYIENHKIF